MKLGKIVILLLIILGAVVFFTKGNTENYVGMPSAEYHQSLSPKEDIRNHSQTFLTFPEWFLVFSPQEYADLTAHKVSSDFTYFGHIVQFWSSYYQIYKATKNDEVFNYEYHTMIMVIGTSTTVEYFIRGLYEFSIGKLTYAISGRVAEDDFTAAYAKDYVDFIKEVPWYEYSFYKVFKNLWDEPIKSKGFFRSLERRYILSTELLIKEGYARIIKWATKSTFETPKAYTAVLLTKELKIHDSEIIFKSKINNSYLYHIPRYDPFSKYSMILAENGAIFEEVAGNRNTILISMIVPSMDKILNNEVFYEQNILTKPGLKRSLILVPIKELHTFLLKNKKKIEHVFDF